MGAITFDRMVAGAVHGTTRRATILLLAGGLLGGLLAGGGISPARAAQLTDSDGDGLYDEDELGVYGTNPYAFDSDFDGSGDGEEVYLGTDPFTAGGSIARADSDGDELYDDDEANVYGTSASAYDSDGDGVGDGQEVYNGTDPLTAGGLITVPECPVEYECTNQVNQSSAASG